jgi:threonine-phosphate decarboxylase
LPTYPIFDFSANLNPFAEILKADTFLKQLEDPDASRSQWHETLVERLAALHQVATSQIALTCGATEAVHLVIRSLKLKSGLVVEPTSLEYRFAMNLYGIEVRNVLLKERAGFHLTISEMMNALHAVGFLAISNPNSPTASEWNLNDLELIIDNARNKQIVTVIDETHVDWKEELSAAPLFQKSDDFIIIRSLSKFYGLAGLRLGYVLASPERICEIKKIQYPNAVLPQACFLALEILKDEAFKTLSLEGVKEERSRLVSSLSEVKWLKLYTSHLNFILAKLQGSRRNQDLKPIFDREKIWIRDCVHYPGLDNHFFRFSVKTHEENLHFIKTIQNIA